MLERRSRPRVAIPVAERRSHVRLPKACSPAQYNVGVSIWGVRFHRTSEAGVSQGQVRPYGISRTYNRATTPQLFHVDAREDVLKNVNGAYLTVLPIRLQCMISGTSKTLNHKSTLAQCGNNCGNANPDVSKKSIKTSL